jgi:Chitobiase/beta-hexosaminidase C-terminal domain
MTGTTFSSGPQHVTFQFVNEPSVIRYTLDGTKPNAERRPAEGRFSFIVRTL